MNPNPYKNRKLPVGKLEYNLNDNEQKVVNSIEALLEYGEKELLYDIPRLLGTGNYINLGCEKGGSAALLARGLKDRNIPGVVYTVDIYPGKGYKRAKRVFEKNAVEDIIVMAKGTTDEWSNKISIDSARFVFIDADHSYRGVRNDFINWSRFIDKGGYIAFHDTNQEYTDRVINELVNDNWKLIYWINRIKVFECLGK